MEVTPSPHAIGHRKERVPDRDYLPPRRPRVPEQLTRGAEGEGLMRYIGRFIGAAAFALLMGFAAGNIAGPTPAAAGSSECDYAVCAFPGEGCSPNPNEVNCVTNELGSCETQECEDPCDPEEPDCEGPLD